MSDPKDGGLFVDAKPQAARPAGAAPKKNVNKRWLMVAAGIALFALVVSSLLSTKPAPRVVKEKPEPMINLTPDVDERSWQVRSQTEIRTVKDENERLQRDIRDLKSAMEKLQNDQRIAERNRLSSPGKLPSNIVGPPQAGDPGSLTQPGVMMPPPPPVPPSVTGQNRTGLPNATSSLVVPPPFTSGVDAQPAEPLVFLPEKRASKAGGPEINAKVKYTKNSQSGMMVAGAFAPIVMLNGIDAGTASGSRSNPQPILMRVQDNAVLPGSAKYSLRSCFILGSGYGDLSAERVYIRLARLSCVDKTDRLVLSTPVQGYVADSDNILGLRGKVTDRQGSRLGKALLAGFAQGLSGALGGAQGTMTSSVLGNTTTVSGDEAMRASGLSGASSAASQLAQFYLKEAQAIFPIISVQGGRDGTVVFTEDVNLTWGNTDAQFVRDVSPDNN